MISTKIFICFMVIVSCTVGHIILSGHQGADYVASRRWMFTKMELSDNGVLHATTTIRAKHLFLGFSGGVAITLFDENNNPLWHSKWHLYGVNLHSTRVEEWGEQVPQELIPRIKKFAISHKHISSDRTKDYTAYINFALLFL